MTSPTDKPMKGPERISKDYCADGEDASWRYPDLKYLEPVTTVEYIRADLVAKIKGTDEAWDSGVLGQSAEHATPQSVVEPTAGGMDKVIEALEQALSDFCDIPDSKEVETPRRLKEAIAIAQSFAERERELQHRINSILDTVSVAYGYLWHVNNEPGTPQQFLPDKAAYAARKVLRDLMTQEQRGRGINEVKGRMNPGHVFYDEALATTNQTSSVDGKGE